MADLVTLPALRVVESVVDLPMPETTGALSIERVWTGERNGIFGKGWETLWDIRLADNTLRGPLPTEPIAAPERTSAELADGTTIRFDGKGRPVSICADAALCTVGEWSDNVLRLSGGTVSVDLALDQGRVISATSSDGRSVAYSYSDGRISSVRTGAESVGYTYQGDRLTAISGVDQRAFHYLGSTLLSMTDRSGQLWRFATSGPDEIEVIDPDGGTMMYTFNDRSLVAVASSERGPVLQRTFDNLGLVKEERPGDGITMTRVAPNKFEVTQVRELEPDRRSLVTVDNLGRVVHSESSSGDVQISYDGRSSRPASTLIGDAATLFEYDDDGLLVATTDPDGYRVTLDRDENGLIRSLTDGVLETRFEYDPAGNPISEQSAGRTTVAQLAADGRVRSLTLANGSTLPVSYDASGTLFSIGSLGDEGVLTELDTALRSTPNVDDAVEEVIRSAAGSEYRYRSGRFARFDVWGRLTEVQVDGRSTTRAYDESGRLTGLTRADGRVFTLTYTTAGRIASVSDGTVTAELAWHGDLLTGATTSTGSSYRYTYDASGRLTSSDVGQARWTYRYDDIGNLAQIGTPSGSRAYKWDEFGRPREAIVDGQTFAYEWSGAGFDLTRVTTPGETLIAIERDIEGQVTSLETVDGRAAFQYSSGNLSGYRLGDGDDVTVTYNTNGEVASIEYGDTIEEWAWIDGEVRTVTIDDDRYDLQWLAPGVPASIERDGVALAELEVDPLGRVESIRNESGDLVGSFKWSSVGLSRAELDGWRLDVEYDDEARPLRLTADGVTLTSEYESGLPIAMRLGDTAISGSYSNGRLVSSRLEQDDRWASIVWSSDGQPIGVYTSEGSGSFDYANGRLTEVLYDDRAWEVTYGEDGQPSADGMADDFVEDLFGSRGTLALPVGEHLAEPWAPWFDALPNELGIDLPSVITAEDVVASAIAQATPSIPRPIAPTDGVAERTAATILAIATPVTFPVAGDRTATLPYQPDESDLAELLSASPTALVGGSVLDKLTDDPCLLCRVIDAGLGTVSAIGRAGLAVAGFLADSTIGQVALSVAFFAASFAVGSLCGVAVACPLALGIAAPLAYGLLSTGFDDLPGALAAAALSPFITLWSGIRELEPTALVSVALTVAAFAAGKASTARFATFWSKVLAPVCNANRVLCVSVNRFGPAAGHIVDAQRNGAPRLLKIDRIGAAARRTSALRNVPSLAGFDRDEYPFAVSSRRSGLSIRYVDPTSNRSLGAYLGRQLSPLPDGARFLVLPIA